MVDLRIRLFGGVEIHRGATPLPSFPTKRAELLFAYLVLNRGRLIHRDVLCGQLWGDQPEQDARKALRTALWRIRSVVEPRTETRGAFLRVEGHQIGFQDAGNAWVDAWEFEECVAPGAAQGAPPAAREAERLARAATLYRGDLLEGFYDEWCFAYRDRFRVAYLDVLERLVAQHRREGAWLEAISWGRQLLRQDPLREHIHRAVMASHLAMGDRPSALRQYESCVRSLEEELDIEPMQETRRLHEQIRAESPSAPGLRRTGGMAVGGREPAGVAAEVEGALQVLYALTERLERTRNALGATSVERS